MDRLALVEKAAEMAAQKVATIHRRRLVTQTFLVAFAISATLGAGSFFFAHKHEEKVIREDSTFNCKLFKGLAEGISKSAELGAKARGAKLSAQQQAEVNGTFQKLLPNLNIKKLSDTQKHAEEEQQTYSKETFLPLLRRDAQLNCENVIK